MTVKSEKITNIDIERQFRHRVGLESQALGPSSLEILSDSLEPVRDCARIEKRSENMGLRANWMSGREMAGKIP
jgi:hypothetical protein